MTSALELAPGSAIGNYRVVRLLGRGGMGAVYLAEHPEIGRQVAIKVVSAELAANEKHVARFRAEALAVNKIRHPNIIDVTDFGALSDGRPYFVMELLEGEDLRARLERESTLSARDALPILRQVTAALSAAHRADIVHRDLKPDNIFLARQHGKEITKLLDFGIAKLRVTDGAATADGALLGTPIYMSPEQAKGHNRDLGPASDLYSLGIILYRIFTGGLPYDAEGFVALVVAHVKSPPIPPSQKVPGFDPRLEAAILRCLAKSPSERFASVAELWRELEPILIALGGEPAELADAPPTVADAAPPKELAPRSGGRRTPLLLGLAAVVVLAGAGVAFWLRHAPPPIAADKLPLPEWPRPLVDGKER